MDLGSINKGLEIGINIFFVSWILIILFFYLKNKKILKKLITIGFFIFFILSLFSLVNQTILTYYSWKADPIGKYLFPPHNSINYFFHYCFTNYYLNYLLTLAGASLIGVLFFIFKKRNHIEVYESWLAVLAALFSGWPNLIIFLGITLLLAIFYSLIQNYTKGGEKRIFLFFPIIVASLITVSFGNSLAQILKLTVLKM